MAGMTMRPALALLFLMLPACALVDQTTFAPDPDPPPAPQIAAVGERGQRVPLITIRFDSTTAGYRELLGYAVREAQRAKPGVQFDVTAIVPPAGIRGDQPNLSERNQRDATTVARDIINAGVPPARVHLAARVDPAAAGREIRVYVR